MTTLGIDNQYATGRSRQRIERALIDGGKDLGHLASGDLGAVEDFHTSGRIATSRLAGLAEITSDDEVLDAGSGVGGTARYLADQFGSPTDDSAPSRGSPMPSDPESRAGCFCGAVDGTAPFESRTRRPLGRFDRGGTKMTRGSTQTKPGDKLHAELDRWAEEADRVIHFNARPAEHRPSDE